MRILVTGSRDWDDADRIGSELSEFITSDCGIIPSIDGLGDVVLVHGACPTGADAIVDKIGAELAESYGLRIERHPADWMTYGRSAGPRRNREMVELGAGICLAFIKNKSKGASMTAEMAARAGIPVRRFEA